MTDIAVVGFAQAPNVAETAGTTNGVEMLVPCFAQLYAELGITKSDIGFWCSGSSDYLAGRAFSFISAIDAIGAVPPINESHVEMDAAWAFYEAWIKLMTGEVDTALVYGFGKSSAGTLAKVLAMQLDPYLVAPLWPDAVSLAGIQARAGIDAGKWDERAMAEVAVRNRSNAHPLPNCPTRSNSSPFCARTTSPIPCARTIARRSPTGRRRSFSPQATAHGRFESARRGSPASNTSSTPPTSVPAISRAHRRPTTRR